MFGSSSLLSEESSNGQHNQQQRQQQQQWSSLLLSQSKPRQEIERRHRSKKAKQRTVLLCLTVGIFFVYCYSILLSQFCLMSSDDTQQQQSISRSLLQSSSIRQQQQQQQQQQHENNKGAGGQGRVVMAVLNGGIREEDYFSSLYKDLIELKDQYDGYLDLMILSDENNYNPNNPRVGEIRLSSFPVDKTFRKMSFNKDKMANGKLSLHQFRISIMWYSLIPLLLSDYPNAEAYWITENDAIICNTTKLVTTFDWFLKADTDNNNNKINKKSLSYWDSCQQTKKRNNNDDDDDDASSSLEFTLYEKNPCGMVSTLLTKDSLLKIQKNLHNSLFFASIEGIFHSTKTMDVCVENGEVLVHGGLISTSGNNAWNEYACSDPQGIKNFKKEKSSKVRRG